METSNRSYSSYLILKKKTIITTVLFRFVSVNITPFLNLAMQVVYLLQISDIPAIIKDLANGRVKWEEVEVKYPKFEQQEATSKAA